MGQAGPGGVLHRAVVRGGRPGHRLWPPSAHAAVEQHLPVDGQSGDHHAVALPDQRDSAQVQETSELSVGAEPHGEELPAGDGGRPEAKLGQLCHLLGEDGDGPEAALLASVSQVSSFSAISLKFTDCFQTLSAPVFSRGSSRTRAARPVGWD